VVAPSQAVGRVLAAAIVAVLGLLVWSAPGASDPAYASCATGHPPRSLAAFTGVVTSTRWQGRLAEVRTDAGRSVTVRGTPGGRSTMTSVDRSYEVGGRYEFHPVNDSSPFEDNNCTATRLLSRGAAVPGTAEHRPPVTGLVVAGALVALAVGGGLAARRRRRARLTTGA